MSVRPGEENVATLFGDVHYFYGPQDANPPHHRFDKGSYVYLFENAGDRRARIEIANRPGLDDQDAFDGFLDRTQVSYSYKHSCMVTIFAPEGSSGLDPSEWHLPTFDPRNENKYHYRLISLDIYFWTQRDALLFVNGVRRVLPPNSLDIQDEPAPPPPLPSDVNPLVQKLESAAISDHAMAAPQARAPNGLPSFAPPPISAVNDPTSAGTSYTTGTTNSATSSFAPIAAYNPAAPVAPEAVRPREKTPPPEDGVLNPLAAAVAYDSTMPFSPGYAPSMASIASPGLPPSYVHPSGAPSFPGPPRQPMGGMASPGLAPPVGFGSHPGMLQRAHTMPPTPGLASPGLSSPYSPAFPGSPGFAPPPSIAATAGVPPPPPSAPTQTPTPPGVASPGLQPPPGGYAGYNYSNPASSPLAGDYGIHNQIYRPTEGEATSKYTPKKEVKGKLEENAGRLERGVTGMLKKFEKKFG